MGDAGVGTSDARPDTLATYQWVLDRSFAVVLKLSRVDVLDVA